MPSDELAPTSKPVGHRPDDAHAPTGTAARLDLLTHGEIEIEGRMPWSSNATFLVHVSAGDASTRAIYKPLRGERPLWDFPSGLYRREVAAFELSEAMGLHLVPPSIVRDGPLGEGSLQWFVNADFQQHYFPLYEERSDLHPQLLAMAVFDLIANNTDRKSGHCLLEIGAGVNCSAPGSTNGVVDKVWGIDHGLCFSTTPKLRTVIWEFGGTVIPAELIERVRPLTKSVPLTVATLLDDDEVEALQRRARRVLGHPVLPAEPSDHRGYPWPLV